MLRCVLSCLLMAAPLSTLATNLTAADNKSWKDQNVRVGDLKVHYLEAGTGDRALVFIPGWTMPAEVWKEQIPYFASRGFHVVALDPRSQGATSKTEEGNTYHQQAADLHAFLKTLKLERSVLIGWSAGVTVILDYISSPETLRPDMLVLVDGGLVGLRQEGYPGGATLQQARTIVSGLQEDRPKYADQFVRSMFKTGQPEFLYKELAEASLKTPTGTAIALFFDLFTGDRRPALARISVPTLVVVTSENRLVGEYMQSKIARSRLEVIEGAGHALFLDKPQGFNQILESFLGK